MIFDRVCVMIHHKSSCKCGMGNHAHDFYGKEYDQILFMLQLIIFGHNHTLKKEMFEVFNFAAV